MNRQRTDQRTDTRPWYRQLWPWLIIAIPLMGVVMSSITVVSAISGADQEVPQAATPMSKTSWTGAERDGERDSE